MKQIIKTQIDCIRCCKFYKEERIQKTINSTDNTQLIFRRLLEYERELIELDRQDNMKGLEKLPDYADDIDKINEELGI